VPIDVVSAGATTTVAPAQEPGPPAQAVQQSAPPPAQQPATAQTTGSMVAAQPAAPPQQTVTAPQGAPPQPSGANAASQQESLRETTGAVVREENTRQASADPTRSPSRANNSQQNVPNSSSNRCDIQACAGTYRSFRANDCTYQPFDGGPRRLCEKSLGQRMARERDQPDRRRWRGHGDTLPRPLEGGPAVP
jgi:hypothetical protein